MKQIKFRDTAEMLSLLYTKYGLRDITLTLSCNTEVSIDAMEYIRSTNPFIITKDGVGFIDEKIEELPVTQIEMPYGKFKVENK